MHNFSKAFRVSIGFIVTVLVLSLLFPVLYLHYIETNWTSRSDLAIRNKYEGQINTLFLSDSHGMYAFVPDIIDRYIGGISYNSSSSLCTVRGRYALMMQEVERNPIDTIVLELSYTTMPEPSERVEGDSLVIQRLSGWKRRFDYLYETISMDNLPTSYYYLFHSALSMFTDLTTLDTKKMTADSIINRGYVYGEPVDITEQKDYLLPKQHIDINPSPTNEKFLRKIIETCQTKNIKIILITVPLPNSILDSYENYQDTIKYYETLADEYGIEYWNFYEDGSIIVDDTVDFTDGVHMSYNGASKVSHELGTRLLNMRK